MRFKGLYIRLLIIALSLAIGAILGVVYGFLFLTISFLSLFLGYLYKLRNTDTSLFWDYRKVQKKKEPVYKLEKIDFERRVVHKRKPPTTKAPTKRTFSGG